MQTVEILRMVQVLILADYGWYVSFLNDAIQRNQGLWGAVSFCPDSVLSSQSPEK
jgi:hypothetical protein